MKPNRLPALAAFAVAVMLIVGQFVSGAKAAPSNQPSAHFQASGITAQVSAPAKSNASKSKTVRPANQSPLDFTVQGRLTDHSGNPITAPTNVVFNLYSVPSGGTAELTQSATITPDSNGLFTFVFVVDTTSNFDNLRLFDSKQYLGIAVGGDAEMTPRFELTASPYAMSLAPGAEIAGNFDYGQNHDDGMLNLFNTNSNNSSSTGLYAFGNIGVWGDAHSNSGGNSYGGYFTNRNSDTGNTQYGVYASASNGYGLYAESLGDGSNQPSWSIFASDGTAPPYNTFANTGVTAYRNDGVFSIGVFGIGPAADGYGVYGTAYNSLRIANGSPSSIGVFAQSYDESSSATGLYVDGSGYASGGFSSLRGFGMVVRYNGSTDLYPGEILALDGNNGTLNGDSIVGVVKVDGASAGAAVGVATYRIATATGPLAAGTKGGLTQQTTYVDNKATVFKPGDLVEIITSGQASVKVSGSVNIGDRVGFASDGSIAATKDSTNSIGKVAGKPDSNGNVIIIVNFK